MFSGVIWNVWEIIPCQSVRGDFNPDFYLFLLIDRKADFTFHLSSYEAA